MRHPLIGNWLSTENLGEVYVLYHRKESKLSLLFSIVSSMPSTRLVHNEYIINKRLKIQVSDISIAMHLSNYSEHLHPQWQSIRCSANALITSPTVILHSFSGEMENKSILGLLKGTQERITELGTVSIAVILSPWTTKPRVQENFNFFFYFQENFITALALGKVLLF